jgi:hypothetical protein
MFSILIPVLALLAPPPLAQKAVGKPVTLGHVFKMGEKTQYQVKSSLQIQARGGGLQTFIPEDLDLSYAFTTEVTKLKTDGIAVVHYLRPHITQVDGETVDHGPVTTVEQTADDYLLTITPVNEIIEMQDLKKPGKAGGLWSGTAGVSRSPLQDPIGQFLGDVYRLALFIGSPEASLDFSPRLSLDEVNVGDTWQRTVSYQPQKLKGKNGKQAVQRLDYTYTYAGVDTYNGRKVHKVTATLGLDTNLGDFINQMMDATPEETGLKGIPLTMKAKIEFFLDFTTMQTLAANATAEGGFKVFITSNPSSPVEEETLKGSTTLRLVGASTVTKKG